MIYSVQILQAAIDTHTAALKRLDPAKGETASDQVFIEHEIEERKGYVQQLKDSIDILVKAERRKKKK